MDSRQSSVVQIEKIFDKSAKIATSSQAVIATVASCKSTVVIGKQQDTASQASLTKTSAVDTASQAVITTACSSDTAHRDVIVTESTSEPGTSSSTNSLTARKDHSSLCDSYEKKYLHVQQQYQDTQEVSDKD